MWISLPVTYWRTTDTTDMTAPHNSPDCFLNISQPWLRHIIRTEICFPHSHTIIITSFSAKHQPASETGAFPGEKSQLGSKVTARRVLVSNRVGKRPDAAEHGRSLNGCKHPKPSRVTKHQRGSRDEGKNQ